MRTGLIYLCALLAFVAFAGSAGAEVDITVQKTLQLDAAPVDVVTSADGLRTFVLTEGGKVLVYSANGQLTDTIDVDKTVDGIEISGKGDSIILLNGKSKTVQIAAIDFIQPINIEGSPFKGDPNGPVVIAVFSDFQ